MSNTIIAIKKSSTPSSVPSNLEFGELALNYADGKIFYKNTSSVIVEFNPTDLSPDFSTINVGGSLITATIQGDTLTVIEGDNTEISVDTLNNSFTITSNISPAYDQANNALAAAVALAIALG